jgi:signal transduction histidine kinase
LGYTAEEMKDRFAMDWHLPEVKDAVLKATEEVMEKGHSSVESSLLAKEGHLVPFFLTGVRFEAQGRLYYMGIGTDITERKRAEEEKSKLEAQNRQLQKAESLGRMAGAIVHHFNNMLQAIIGNMQLAIRRLPRDEDSVKYMAAAMQAARSAETITSQTLTYLGDTSDKLETLDLGDVCRLFLPTLQAAMPKNVSLETDLPSRGPTITANANQMQQVLTNLVTNAWEALGDGRSIIHLRVKTVSAADIPAIHSPTDWRPQDSVYICLEVSDTGSGIAHSDIENLFDPFFSGKFIGRGLGLSVVLGIARAHHGAVSVQSEPGQGSTFCVFLPAAAEDVVV